MVLPRGEIMKLLSGLKKQVHISDLGVKIWILILSTLIVFSAGYYFVSYSSLTTGPQGETVHLTIPKVIDLPLVGIAAFLTVTSTFIYYWMISALLTKLTRAAEQLGAGDYGNRLKVEGPSMVKKLAQAFNIMAAQLEENMEQHSRLQQTLEELVITDDLTGVYNRRELNRLLHLEFRRAKRFKRPLAMILYDIDHYKQVNDNFGHLIGDQVLIWLTNLIANNTRATNFIARFGGDEFVILLPETTSEKAYQVAERLRTRVSEFPFEGLAAEEIQVKFGITISLGVAELNDELRSAEAFFAAADQALYKAKHSGRNQTQIAAHQASSI
jgi:diguanylate cyclase (GGDEF)-like protein